MLKITNADTSGSEVFHPFTVEGVKGRDIAELQFVNLYYIYFVKFIHSSSLQQGTSDVISKCVNNSALTSVSIG